MTPLLDALTELGVVRPLDLRFAQMLRRRAGVDDDLVLAAAALAGSLPATGHVCLDLDAIGALLEAEAQRAAERAVGTAPESVPLPTLPDPSTWADALAAARSVVRLAGEDRATPLVLAGRSLYLDRYWTWQLGLVAAIRSRVGVVQRADVAQLTAGLDRLFDDDPKVARQRQAVATALLTSFSVIAGGPGTGKTAVVVRLLALLNHLAALRGRPLPRVTLVAPTGKAAARLTESIRATRDTWLPEDMRAGVTDEASTIHRRLAISPRTGRPRYHADNPLLADVVVVDEASMVDLPLMTRLMDALPADAKLILLGDPDQLVSVEMGAVLGDIRAAAGGPKSAAAGEMLGWLGSPLDADEVGGKREPTLADSLTVLDHTWRFSGAIGGLARAINAGDAPGALAVLDGDDPAATRLEQAAGSGRRGLHALLRKKVVTAYTPVVRASDPAQALAALRTFRVLCAHRRGTWGVESLNAVIEEWLSEAGLLRLDGPWYVGRPVMVRRNDPRRGLYNGDVGVVLAGDDPEHRQAWFEGPGGVPRAFTLGALPEHETVFATTVHKSQGSEYDEVLVVLPDGESALLTRELLYTAVTRASVAVTVVGSAERIAGAVERRVQRMSGLRRELS
jgi:exodeoxyribonuclease V alpha subunit